MQEDLFQGPRLSGFHKNAEAIIVVAKPLYTKQNKRAIPSAVRNTPHYAFERISFDVSRLRAISANILASRSSPRLLGVASFGTAICLVPPVGLLGLGRTLMQFLEPCSGEVAIDFFHVKPLPFFCRLRFPLSLNI
jgi:hypothetical protein